ncbi:MAG: 6-phosphogluconolactonase [Microbacteriaceae bacterium]|nr:6-phosphogluconolactonase [Microbacteriaceae bacterium]MDR9443437.1 6-phosphogluconolactonase [Microbacteriaceae bacterium]
MRQIQVYPDSDQLVEAVVEQSLELLSGMENPRVALSGGGTGVLIAAGLIQALSASNQLQKVMFFMADERFVEIDDPQSNLGQIKTLIGDLNPNIYSFELPPETTIMESVSRANEDLGEKFSFDLALMGCGPDGHTASLFPGHDYPEQTVIAETNSPKPPAQRISFGYSVFQRSSNVWFVASGAEKATAVSQGLIGNSELPVGRITGINTTNWFITEELA